jgi:hypothetical protein
MRQHAKRRASRRGRGFAFASLTTAAGLLNALPAAAETIAMNTGESARWQPETVVQFSVRTDYASTRGHLTTRDATVGTMHLRLRSSIRPVTAGLMFEVSAIDEQADTLLIAGMFTCKISKWTAAVSPFYTRKVQRAAGNWRYWGSVRRQITPRHSVGVELFGALETGRPTKWLLGYSAAITETLSVSVAAGRGLDVGPDWLARAALTWRPRLGRH